MMEYQFNMTTQFMARWVLLFSIIILGACSFTIQSNNTPSPSPETVRNTPQIFSTAASPTPLPPENVWLALIQKNPYPYTTPIPARTPTVLDSIYVKVEPQAGKPVPCRRCPDYLIEGGLWKLSLDKGSYHIFHEGTRWGGLGSYSISGDRLYLFNDPTCYDEIGIYKWKIVGGGMKLEVVEDKCQVGRRGWNFAQIMWQSCQPPSVEAAVTDHWSRPIGCEN
jgi:hypothetical protein